MKNNVCEVAGAKCQGRIKENVRKSWSTKALAYVIIVCIRIILPRTHAHTRTHTY